MNNPEKLHEMETFYMAFADKTRLRILNLMRRGEICVCFLVEVLGESQPKISRHLAYLRSAGVVEARREGKWIYYKIVEPKDDPAAWILQNTLSWLDSKSELRSEYKKLAEVSRSADKIKTTESISERLVSVSTDISRYQREELETFLL